MPKVYKQQWDCPLCVKKRDSPLVSFGDRTMMHEHCMKKYDIHKCAGCSGWGYGKQGCEREHIEEWMTFIRMEQVGTGDLWCHFSCFD